MTDTPPPKTPVKQVSVTLARDHRHGGKFYTKGATIEVAETIVPWMRGRNLIQGQETKHG